MYLRKFNKPKGLYLAIYEKYYVKGYGSKEKIVKTIGYVSQYTDQYSDPVAHFEQVVSEMNSKRVAEDTLTISLDTNQQLENNTDDLKNVGYAILKQMYKELELDKFWKQVTKGYQIQYDINEIFQMLLFSRILFPASKKKSFENKSVFFEEFNSFSLDDVYHALDIYAENEENLQKWIYNHSVTKYNRDLSVGYFDCTNYYYDISRPDEDEYDEDGNLTLKRYRKFGPEKNHRKDPIIELGLLMDKTGIPLAYDLFPGNESEKVHMLPILNRARSDYGFGKIIVVADRGLNTSDNIYKLNVNNKGNSNSRDGYVYGQSIRGADAEFKQWAIDKSGFSRTKISTPDSDSSDDIDEEMIFIHKSRIYPKKIYIKRTKADGTTVMQSIQADQKQMVYYSKKYAIKQKTDRNRSIERAKDLIKYPKKYDKISAKGASGYVMNISYNQETGEIIDKNLILDENKIAEEEKYDGYYSIVTSELKMDDLEIRNIYRGLIKIEDTFRITKSELDTRPIFVRTNEHIEAHFSICFTAIVFIRCLQVRLNNKYPVGILLESLKKYNCIHLDKNTYQFIYYNEVLDDCGKAFDLNLKSKYRKRAEIRKLLKY